MARNRTEGSISEPEELDSIEDQELDAEASVELDDADELEDEFEPEDDEAPAARASHRSSGAAEAKTVASQQLLREQLAREVEEFLARGGRINVVEPRMADRGGQSPGAWGSDGQVSE